MIIRNATNNTKWKRERGDFISINKLMNNLEEKDR